MDSFHFKECEDIKVEKIPYMGRMHDVIGTSIRWLSKHGDDGNGVPEYGLRYFTVQPGGQIPIHSHFYHQTMYILSGKFECWEFDPEKDRLKKKVICGPGFSIYVPSKQPHGMKNISDDPSAFLCCICNVYDNDEIL
ncbi:MAG: cupin domain-containing protein [Deltaproteobacteria bacterium]|nr:cupin domain-containing protein [Deltaproteobacteria bacterium]